MILLAVSLLLAGCTANIADIKDESHVGKTVVVKGTVENTIKIGKLSGYSLVDSRGDKISVSSASLPEEGKQVTIKGVLMKDTLLGYYIKAD